jgi:hypothetical protein
MATLAGHFADLVAFGGRQTDAHRGRMDAFEVAINRAVRDLREREVPSVVAFMWIRRGTAMSDLVDTMLKVTGGPRDLEFPYIARDPSGNSFVYVLLPAADEEAAKALEERLEAVAKSRKNTSLAALGASFSYHLLQPGDSLLGIFRLFAKQAQQRDQRPGRYGRASLT